jgi:hypothetical protein
VYINGRKIAHCFVDSTGLLNYIVPSIDAFADDYSVWIEDAGDWSDDMYDPDFEAVEFEALCSKSIVLQWVAVPLLKLRGTDSVQLFNLSLTGLKRFENCKKINNRPLWGEIDVVVYDTAGTRTVELQMNGEILCSGSRVGDGVITLVEQNRSMLSGEIEILYIADVPVGQVFITAFWPREYQVHYSTSPLVFPRTPEKVVPDNGFAKVFRYSTPRLNAGIYNCAVLQVSDAGIVQTSASTIDTKEIKDIPAAPCRLAYLDGDTTNTRLIFNSFDNTSSFNVYDSGIITEDAPASPRMTAPDFVEGPGLGQHTIILSPLE